MYRTIVAASVLVVTVHLSVAVLLAHQIDDARRVLDRAVEDFLAGRVAESLEGFDRVAAMAPQAAPQLWQRGIAQYYLGRYDDCRRQFESHRAVNPNDVENPAWHFLCVAKAESPARAREALLPVGPDQRSPMREIYEMFRGRLAPDAVLRAGRTTSDSAEFYAELYVGLYYEGMGDTARALPHLKAAAANRFARVGGYMHRVAALHPLVVGGR
jgi:lipoprotein NlpI